MKKLYPNSQLESLRKSDPADLKDCEDCFTLQLTRYGNTGGTIDGEGDDDGDIEGD